MPLLNLQALRDTPLSTKPFDFAVVPDFVTPEAVEQIQTDFPAVDQGGSFPLSSLSYGPRFAALVDELMGDETREAFAQKFALDLTGRPATLTVRGRCRAKDGKIHLDSKTKLITVLIYLNPPWVADGGRLRLLRSPDDIDDMVTEIPPYRGTMVAFRCSDNAWHGHKSYEGQRRAIQLNWVTDESAARTVERRHGWSARLKRMFG